MGDFVDDFMGMLIDWLDSVMCCYVGLYDCDVIIDYLYDIKWYRNYLCYVLWWLMDDFGLWYLVFVNMQGVFFEYLLGIGDLCRILYDMVQIGQCVIGVMCVIGIDGYWVGDDQV